MGLPPPPAEGTCAEPNSSNALPYETGHLPTRPLISYHCSPILPCSAARIPLGEKHLKIQMTEETVQIFIIDRAWFKPKLVLPSVKCGALKESNVLR